METIVINTESAHLTEEQFFNLCAGNKEIRFERDKHQNIYIMAPTGSWISSGQIGIAAQLWIWNNKSKLGNVFESSGGFTLPNTAMRAPDAAWISKERWQKIPQEDKERFAHICPDFVVEVRSKSDTLKQIQEKMQEWIENGCRLAWLVDVENRYTYIYQPGCETLKKSFHEKLTGGKVLPGFILDLMKIF